MTPKFIAILEDNLDRVVAMRFALARLVPQFNPIVFQTAPDMIEWLRTNLIHTVLICLDHDLGPNRPTGGRRRDPGSGRQVAEYLATQLCVCPVVVHSSNSVAVPGMLRVLRESLWICSAVTPRDHLAWIASDWSAEIDQYLRRGLIFP